MKNIKAFTLAEIMAVFTVIGILTAILLPAAMNSAPDQNVVRLKRAVGAFGDAVREMVNSEDYFFAGDLGKMPDETLIETKYTYVCNVLADIISSKTVPVVALKKVFRQAMSRRYFPLCTHCTDRSYVLCFQQGSGKHLFCRILLLHLSLC